MPAKSTRYDQFSSGAKATVRTGRAGEHEVLYTQPFKTTLYIQKTGQGCACVIALEGTNFAEFDPRRAEEEPGLLQTESYYLEIFEIEGVPLRPFPQYQEVTEAQVLGRISRGMRE